MSIPRIIGIILVYCTAVVAWLGLGALMMVRTNDTDRHISSEVESLWGHIQVQEAPAVTFYYPETEVRTHTETIEGQLKVVKEEVEQIRTQEVALASSDIDADMTLDQRRKGLMWYPLYGLAFDGRWTYEHREEKAGTVELSFAFPDASGVYDGFVFLVDGADVSRNLVPEKGKVLTRVPVEPGQVVAFQATYRTRGQSQWTYRPSTWVASVENFNLDLTTDFEDIDFPQGTLSPTTQVRENGGAQLSWRFDRLVSGFGIGVECPTLIQPGELAAELAFSAPISLFFFFLILFVLAAIRDIDIHPINYLFLASAFFAFHLLFSYSVDHISVVPAFAMASVVSVLLVVSYLRLVVSSRFAFVEAGAAQLVYLVGFSLAHFWDGYTGLTVTVLSIATLFIIMQLTGRTQWGEVLSRRTSLAKCAAEPATQG